MHKSAELAEQVSQILRFVIPLLASLIAHRRADKAYRKAKAVEQACSFPACGHICAPVDISTKGK